MNGYFSWIKEIMPLQYDNSKSEYQVISELIPILLKIKDYQNTFSETINTYDTDTTNKCLAMSKQLSDYITTLTNNIASFKETTNTSIKDMTDNFNRIVSEYQSRALTLKDKYTSDMTTNENNFQNDIKIDYTMLLDKINNYLSNILKDYNFYNVTKTNIDNHYTDTINNIKKNPYIDITYWTDTMPTSGNLNEYWYNPNSKTLYQWLDRNNIVGWHKRTIRLNQYYNYNGKLYYGDANLIQTFTEVTDAMNMIYQIDDNNFIYYNVLDKNIYSYDYSTKTKTLIGTPNLPTGTKPTTDTEPRFYPIRTFTDTYYKGTYYVMILTRNTNNLVYKLYTTTDWLNYTLVSIYPTIDDELIWTNPDNILYYIFDDTLYIGIYFDYKESSTSDLKYFVKFYSTNDNTTFNEVTYIPIFYFELLNKYLVAKYELQNNGNLHSISLYYSDDIIGTNAQFNFLQFINHFHIMANKIDDNYLINQYYGIPNIGQFISYFASVTNGGGLYTIKGFYFEYNKIGNINYDYHYYDKTTTTFKLLGSDFPIYYTSVQFKNGVNNIFECTKIVGGTDGYNILYLKPESYLTEYTGG